MLLQWRSPCHEINGIFFKVMLVQLSTVQIASLAIAGLVFVGSGFWLYRERSFEPLLSGLASIGAIAAILLTDMPRIWALGVSLGALIVFILVTLWLLGMFPFAKKTAVNPVTPLISEGQRHYEAGRYDQALNNYEQALVIAREVGDRAGEGATLNNIGEV